MNKQQLLGNLAVAASYFGLAYLTFSFLAAFSAFPAPIWPAASIALAAALAGGPRLWPGIWLGSFFANWLLFSAPAWAAALISVGNVVGPALGAMLIRRTTGTAWPFFNVVHVVHFVLWGVALHGIIVATVGVLVGMAYGTTIATDAMGSWWRWTLSDAGGTFLFGPALLLWWNGHLRLTTRQWLEGGAVVVTALGFAAGLFFGVRADTHPFFGLPYLLLIPLMWLTVRCSLRAGTTLLSGIALVALTGTIAQVGPFHLLGAKYPLLDVGVMVVAMGISTLVVGALVSERHAAEQRLCELNESLERRIAERTADLHERATRDGLTGLANRS